MQKNSKLNTHKIALDWCFITELIKRLSEQKALRYIKPHLLYMIMILDYLTHL